MTLEMVVTEVAQARSSHRVSRKNSLLEYPGPARPCSRRIFQRQDRISVVCLIRESFVGNNGSKYVSFNNNVRKAHTAAVLLCCCLSSRPEARSRERVTRLCHRVTLALNTRSGCHGGGVDCYGCSSLDGHHHALFPCPAHHRQRQT